jgi:hypothetical protein
LLKKIFYIVVNYDNRKLHGIAISGLLIVLRRQR